MFSEGIGRCLATRQERFPRRPCLASIRHGDYTSEWIGGACFSLPFNHWQTYEKLRTLGRLSITKRFARPMAEYRRRLPHFHPDGEYLFVTWRLHGSLPVVQPEVI